MKRLITNPQLAELIEGLKGQKAKIWKDLAKRLSKPNRSRIVVNVSRLNRYGKNGESILVPGKLLGAGNIEKKLSVTAWSFSETARKKVEEAGGKCIPINDLVKKNPTGSKVRILG